MLSSVDRAGSCRSVRASLNIVPPVCCVRVMSCVCKQPALLLVYEQVIAGLPPALWWPIGDGFTSRGHSCSMPQCVILSPLNACQDGIGNTRQPALRAWTAPAAPRSPPERAARAALSAPFCAPGRLWCAAIRHRVTAARPIGGSHVIGQAPLLPLSRFDRHLHCVLPAGAARRRPCSGRDGVEKSAQSGAAAVVSVTRCAGRGGVG